MIETLVLFDLVREHESVVGVSAADEALDLGIDASDVVWLKVLLHVAALEHCDFCLQISHLLLKSGDYKSGVCSLIF